MALINCRGKSGNHSSQKETIVLREDQKSVNTQKKIDSQLQTAQQSAGQQIDSRIDKNLAGLDAKVKSIIEETVKRQSIKKEAIYFDPSLLECDLTSEAIKSQQSPHPVSSFSKRNRQADNIDLRSPTYEKREDSKNNRRPQSAQSKGPYIVMITYNTNRGVLKALVVLLYVCREYQRPL